MSESLDWINVRDMNRQPRPGREIKLDEEVSKVVGKPVSQTDPRLIRLIVEFKKKHNSTVDSDVQDNFMHRPDFLVALKKVFNET